MRQETKGWISLLILGVGLLLLAACAPASTTLDSTSGERAKLVIGAIPDQDPELLGRNYKLLADYLSAELDVDVEYRPVTEYEAAVAQFKAGDLDLVWFGGLTGVQARLAVDGAEAIAQRDIDAKFTSVFIANSEADIDPIASVEGLAALKGKRFTFGSESSTSGRLMPQSFLQQANVTLEDFDGEPGFSGNHDATIQLVEVGSFEVGALNSQVWNDRVAAGDVDTEKVQLIFETPEYFDYHWVAHPDIDQLDGELKQKIIDSLTELDLADPDEATILEFFAAEKFVTSNNKNYDAIEQVGRDIGKIS